MTNIRKSNLELLRIISIFMIIAYHAVRNIHETDAITQFVCDFIGNWGILGVNCFLIISFWFIIEKSCKKNKIVTVIIQTFEYSFLFLLLSIIHNANIGNENIIKYIFSLEVNGFLEPLWSRRYWYVTIYIFICLISPIYNKLIENMDINQYKKLVIFSSLLVFYCSFDSSGWAYEILFYSWLYFVVGYLKKNKNNILEKKAGLFLLTGFLCILFISLITFIFSPQNYFFWILWLRERDCFLTVILAICLFYLFLHLEIQCKAINIIAGNVFGIYLFHENSLYNICNISYYYLTIITKNHVFITYICVICLLFVLGSIVECLRNKITYFFYHIFRKLFVKTNS
ncbi:MAG: acyltransferase family protein [Thermoflexaceae bacterium]|nr:acyltransferase family protein [Thermoflexaceae bacterium]